MKNICEEVFRRYTNRIAQNSTRVDTRELANHLLHPEKHETTERKEARAPAITFTNSTASWLHPPPIYSRLPQRVPDVFTFCLGVLVQICSVGLCCSRQQLCAVKSADQHFNFMSRSFVLQPHSQRASVISNRRRNFSIRKARRCGSTTDSGWEGAPQDIAGTWA